MLGQVVKVRHGYGFARISNRRQDHDVFIHQQDFVNPDDFGCLDPGSETREGTKLHFDVIETERGLRATNIVLV